MKTWPSAVQWITLVCLKNGTEEVSKKGYYLSFALQEIEVILLNRIHVFFTYQ